MTDDDRLRRAYRRLMWAYPGWYRRERGLELLTTLLDAAAPGQRRPGWRDAVDVIGGGVRARLRPPRGAGSYAAAALIALWVALAAAAGSVLLTSYPGPPSTARAIAAAAVAVPGAPPDVPGPVVHCDIICPEWDGRDSVVAFDAPADRTDRVVVSYAPPAREAPAIVTRARERLAEAGWDVTSLLVQNDGIASFEASGDGLSLWVTAWPTGSSGDTVSIVVSKGFSAAAVAALAAGFPGGLLAGWLLATWMLQRRRRLSRTRQAAISAAVIPLLMVAVATVAQTPLFLLAKAADDGFTPNDVQIPQFVLSALPALLPGAAVVGPASALLA
ncbi:MAG TPA: hypothetical protein VF755_18210, partial [Catenuloplanes sp.]